MIANMAEAHAVIREAHLDDLRGITAVQLACGRAPWRRVVFTPDRRIVVAVTDGVIVGAAKTHFFPRAEATPEGTVPAGHYLGGITVHPEHRRRGVGTALTEARLQWIWERANEAYFYTDDTNTASIRMHAAMGFAELSRHIALRSSRADNEHLILFGRGREASRALTGQP